MTNKAEHLQEPRGFGANLILSAWSEARAGRRGTGGVFRRRCAADGASAKGDGLERLAAVVDFELLRPDLLFNP